MMIGASLVLTYMLTPMANLKTFPEHYAWIRKFEETPLCFTFTTDVQYQRTKLLVHFDFNFDSIDERDKAFNGFTGDLAFEERSKIVRHLYTPPKSIIPRISGESDVNQAVSKENRFPEFRRNSRLIGSKSTCYT